MNTLDIFVSVGESHAYTHSDQGTVHSVQVAFNQPPIGVQYHRSDLTSSELSGTNLILSNGRSGSFATGIVATVAFPSGSLEAKEFVPYYSYTGNLAVAGAIGPITTSGTTQTFTYTLTNTDPACSSGAGGLSNSCGIHIHSGTTCTEHALGHYFTGEITTDPWTAISYTSTSTGAAEGTVSVNTGATAQEVQGRAMIIHDFGGARIACAILTAPAVDYDGSYISVGPSLPHISLQSHAVAVISGAGAQKKDLRLYDSGPHQGRNLQFEFDGISKLSDYVSAPDTYIADGIIVSSFARPSDFALSFAVWNAPSLLPKWGVVMSELSFPSGIDMSKFNTVKSSSYLEGYDFSSKPLTIIDVGTLFLAPGCTVEDLDGDFNRKNGFTIGDAIYVAQMWAEQVPMTSCLGGDFNQNNVFNIGDAVFVATVWTGEVKFPWDPSSRRRSRQLSRSPSPVRTTSAPAPYHGAIVGVPRGTRTLDIVVSLGTSSTYVHEEQSTRFSAVSVSFNRRVVGVQVHVAGLKGHVDTSSQRAVQFEGPSESARFSIGRIATVTFEEDNARVDYGSKDTYITVGKGIPPVTFGSSATVVLTGGPTTKNVTVFSKDEAIKSLTLEFDGQNLGGSLARAAPPSFMAKARENAARQKAQDVLVNAFTNVHKQQIGYGVLGGLAQIPTETKIAQLAFEEGMRVRAFNATRSMAEGLDYQPLSVTIIDAGEALLRNVTM